VGGGVRGGGEGSCEVGFGRGRGAYCEAQGRLNYDLIWDIQGASWTFRYIYIYMYMYISCGTFACVCRRDLITREVAGNEARGGEVRDILYIEHDCGCVRLVYTGCG